MTVQASVRQAKDYATNQEVRWCPGCGDFAILRAVQKALSELGADPDRTVFVSGIGCAARMPYYLATYGFHGIHGRAPAIATGVKLADPTLDVWVVGGDGDMLSIGTNHLLHALRRDVDLTILLLNNAVYGLTKGQASPTSPRGTRSPSSPEGTVERPMMACRLALAAGGSFVARGIDTQMKLLPETLKRAKRHPGAAMVEIIQNCIVYNDGGFDSFASREAAAEHQLLLEHGKPLRFGEGGTKGLRLRPGTAKLEVVELGEDGVGPEDLLVHDETDLALAQLLANLEPPMPVPIGVLYAAPAPTSFERAVHAGREPGTAADLDAFIRRATTWQVGPGES